MSGGTKGLKLEDVGVVYGDLPVRIGSGDKDENSVVNSGPRTNFDTDRRRKEGSEDADVRTGDDESEEKGDEGTESEEKKSDDHSVKL